jgi:hypothetical protein
MKAKQMHKYLMDNYGEVRHDMDNMEYACKQVAKEYDVTPKDIFLFMIEDRPLPISSGIATHSYGFYTREGRALKKQFESYYIERYLYGVEEE